MWLRKKERKYKSFREAFGMLYELPERREDFSVFKLIGSMAAQFLIFIGGLYFAVWVGIFPDVKVGVMPAFLGALILGFVLARFRMGFALEMWISLFVYGAVIVTIALMV